MKFQRLTDEKYQQFVRGRERYAYTQLPSYMEARRADGMEVEPLGLVDDEGTVCAACLVSLQPWKRVFRRAHIAYGPEIDYDDAELVREFFTGLRSYYRFKLGVISLRFNPPLVRNFYDDVTPIRSNPAAQTFEDVMEELGIERVEQDYTDSADIQMRFVYVKDLEGLDYAGLARSVEQPVRTGFNREGTNGVRVRMARPEEMPLVRSILDHTAERSGMHPVSEYSYRYYALLAQKMGPENFFMPIAELDCEEALRLTAAERSEVEATQEKLEGAQREAESTGRTLGKKQRNQLKEAGERLAILAKREETVRAIKEESGSVVPLAAAIFIRSPHELIYLLAGAYEEYQAFQGTYLIHKKMLEFALSNDVRWYNFFGISGDFTPEAPDAGVLRFKRQFRGHVEEYVGTYDMPTRRVHAKMLGALK